MYYADSAADGAAIATGIGAIIIPLFIAFAIAIVALVFTIKTIKKAVQFADPTDSGLVEIILSLVFAPVAFFLVEKKFAAACATKGIDHQDRSILYLILGLFGFSIVDLILMYMDVKKINGAYTNEVQ